MDVNGEIGKKGGRVPGPDGYNKDHFCIRVDPFDESAIRDHLAVHGIEAGPTQTRYGAEGSGPSIYLHDPDGNTVELKGPPESPEPMDFRPDYFPLAGGIGGLLYAVMRTLLG